MDKLWFLTGVDILQDLAPADLEQIAARAPMQSVAAGAAPGRTVRAASQPDHRAAAVMVQDAAQQISSRGGKELQPVL